MLDLLNRLFVKSVLAAQPGGGAGADKEIKVSEKDLGFAIPDLSLILTFFIRGFFAIAGLFALIYLLLGAFAWVTSGGSKENVEKAQQKIQAAIIGLIMIVVVLAVVVTLEKIVFNEAICFGISCPLSIPALLKKS